MWLGVVSKGNRFEQASGIQNEDSRELQTLPFSVSPQSTSVQHSTTLASGTRNNPIFLIDLCRIVAESCFSKCKRIPHLGTWNCSWHAMKTKSILFWTVSDLITEKAFREKLKTFFLMKLKHFCIFALFWLVSSLVEIKLKSELKSSVPSPAAYTIRKSFFCFLDYLLFVEKRNERKKIILNSTRKHKSTQKDFLRNQMKNDFFLL